MGELLWPAAAAIVGVFFALQWGKTRAAKLELKKTEALRALEAENRKSQDAEQARIEKQFELSLLDTPEGRELKASEMLLKAAQNRREAAEQDAQAKFAEDVAAKAAENEKIVDRARMQALVKQADTWAKEHPPKAPKDPVREMDLNLAYSEYCTTCQGMVIEPATLGDWLGDNYAQLMNRAS